MHTLPNMPEQSGTLTLNLICNFFLEQLFVVVVVVVVLNIFQTRALLCCENFLWFVILQEREILILKSSLHI